MLDRRARQVGVQMIETALSKKAEIITPTLGSLKAKKTKQLGVPDSVTAMAVMPKVLTIPG